MGKKCAMCQHSKEKFHGRNCGKPTDYITCSAPYTEAVISESQFGLCGYSCKIPRPTKCGASPADKTYKYGKNSDSSCTSCGDTECFEDIPCTSTGYTGKA